MGNSNINDFTAGFEDYSDSIVAGVLLPKIKIEPRFYKRLNIDESSSNLEFLTRLCRDGILQHNIHKADNKEKYYERVKMELSILNELGFIDYILLNWDILNFCHENDIPTGPGRGSAAGSLVLFLIGVTQIDPVQYDLFFERFVSKSRARQIEKDGITYLDGSLLADIDNDIAYEHRHKVVTYIEESYPNRTAKILTLNTLSGKLCIKECGKLAGALSEGDVNLISDFIPKVFGKVMPLKDALEESEKLAEWAEANPKVFAISRKLEGLNKNTGVHPSGIAISHQLLTDICPVQHTKDGALVTAYDMNWVAELMVKFDILGLRTLSVIQNTCNALGMDSDSIPVDSPKIYDNLQGLRSPRGLFQIEAETNFKVCKKIAPRDLEELSAVVALARPGALDFLDDYIKNREKESFSGVHPIFNEILSYTGGIPLYQEQLMKMAVAVGFSLDESEQLRRIVGKKKIEEMPKWKSKIEQKIIENNLPHEVGDFLWKVAEDSANYSFNKSHSIAYATLAAWTTYLKFNYPQEFFLSLLKMTKFEPAPHEEISAISKELAFFDIKLLPPEIVKSQSDFFSEGKDIRFGLNSIKGISDKSMDALNAFRQTEINNKYDIFLAAKSSGLNIGILSAFIQAGALSSYKTNRCRLVLEAQAFNILTDREKRNFMAMGEKYDWDILNSIVDCVKNESLGDDGKVLIKPSRFETFKKKYDKYKAIYNKNKKYENFANWYFENQLLGYSYSQNLRDVFRVSAGELSDSLTFESLELRESRKFVGTVEDVFKRRSKNGNEYIKLILSDEKGSIPCMMINRRARTNTGWVQKNSVEEFLSKNGGLPDKGSIAVVSGSKGEDILFIDSLSIMDEIIYMKLSDLK